MRVVATSAADRSVTATEAILGMYTRVSGCATAADTGVRHWHHRCGSEGAPVVSLINGSDFATDMWHAEFVYALLDAGSQVLLYGPRDCGRSERLPFPKGFKSGTWSPELPPPYPLDALADELSGVLDELKVEKTHLIGISMGGMIGQLMAIEHLYSTLVVAHLDGSLPAAESRSAAD